MEIPQKVICLMDDNKKVIKYYPNLIEEIKKTNVEGVCIQGINNYNKYTIVNKLI